MKHPWESRFRQIMANLPVSERNLAIVVLDEQPYSWNVVWIEVINNTELSHKMLDFIQKIMEETK